ncbi:DUF998 domain-containing protein [Methanosphaera sp. ISO3-F5]|uniref:DUF998 domain-containing protein n=1 Tax=Methanosphaera sp. ISO3-F5 TaxID=1452353 RepID=UPI002B2642ED|nr:DUF998 domain-containing protein [Methanosphaera sp. ISO3-F5]WQH63730.1 DUF998 domain-containing protein [Methanosphaera sp. ISO3-F5]
MKSKLASSVFLSVSTFYILAEAFCALFFKDSLINTYLIHTISELGIPGANSPYSILMNIAFILMGLAVLFGNYYYFKKYITKNRIPFYILTLVTAVGVIIVGLIHGGNPLTSGYHTLGAVMAILGGNILLILISRSMKEFSEYQKITLILGIIGLIAFWIMFFSMKNVYMPVLERLSVYTLILWSFVTGVYCNKNLL